MRFSQKIYFVLEAEGQFNEETGDYDEPTETVTEKYAHVSDTSTQKASLMYSDVLSSTFTVRLQGAYIDDFNYIKINDIKYKCDKKRLLKNKSVFFVSEIV